MTRLAILAALAATAVAGAGIQPAQAQTAADINRLNAAIQICNSPMGAGTPECAQLRAKMGGGGGLGGGGLGGLGGGGGLGGLGGGKAAAAAGILGLLNQARSQASAQAAPAAPMGANPAAVQQAIATCVQNAGGNNAAIQACLQIATAAPPQQPAYGGPALLPTAQRAQDSAMATYAGAQSYQACAAANPTNWQQCLPLMNGGAPAPAANPFGALLPRR